MIGNLDQALECQKRSVAIKEELGHKHDIFMSLINLSRVCGNTSNKFRYIRLKF